MPSQDLYVSENLRAFARADHASATLLVAFAHWVPEQRLDAPGFAEALAERHGLDIVCVNCASNAWWQYPDMPAAIEAIRQFAASWHTLVTYGSSMGGYAALRYAAALGARRAIAISPQYSIDPAKVPFEHRYAAEQRTVSFVDERRIAYSPGCDYVAVYDPFFSLDLEHICRISAEVSLTHVRFPLSGHPSMAALDAAGLASRVAHALIEDCYDRTEVRQALRAARRDSPHYWITLSLKLQERRHAALALTTALIYARICDDKDVAYRWAFARAQQMDLDITLDALGALSDDERRIVEPLWVKAGEAGIYAALTPIFRGVLGRKDVHLTSASTAADVPGWNSFRQVEIILEVEEYFGIKLGSDDVDHLLNVGDLVRAIARRRFAKVGASRLRCNDPRENP